MVNGDEIFFSFIVFTLPSLCLNCAVPLSLNKRPWYVVYYFSYNENNNNSNYYYHCHYHYHYHYRYRYRYHYHYHYHYYYYNCYYYYYYYYYYYSVVFSLNTTPTFSGGVTFLHAQLPLKKLFGRSNNYVIQTFRAEPFISVKPDSVSYTISLFVLPH